MKNIKRTLVYFLLLFSILLAGCSQTQANKETIAQTEKSTQIETSQESVESESTAVSNVVQKNFSLSDIPEYSGKAYVAINNNVPFFTDSEVNTKVFETYSNLDSLGRCAVAYANVCKDIMPTQERGDIGSVKPSGWQTVKYDNVDGKYLYNRCHLIGFQLAGENANNKNLITGTRYLNVDGMLPFENMVADYVKETGNHVLYRVTPIFEGNNLVASGVEMEAKSVEDNGAGILFNVYAYNIQPGITINYANGDSSLANTPVQTTAVVNQGAAVSSSTYILNTNTHKFHKPSCSSVKSMSEANKQEFTGSSDDIISKGYEPCKICNP